MCSDNYLKPEFSPDAFAGTAEYYSRYRIPYPQKLIDDLLNRIKSAENNFLVDLACGPGRLTLRLAPYFLKVLANDADSEMISVGKVNADKCNFNNIEWVTGKAEELHITPNSVDIITIGEAFHRLDQNLITNQTLRWLKLGGYIVIMGCYGILSGNELWQNIIKKIVEKWTSHDFSSYKKSAIKDTNRGPEHYRLFLQNNGFDECNSYSFVFPHYWTVETIIGNLYSTSFCSKKVLGDNTDEFESGLQEALYKIDKRGRFFENIRCGYTLGRKPH